MGFYLRGQMAGKLLNLQKVWYSRGRPPLPLVHVFFEGLDLKFHCKSEDTWEKTNVLWSANTGDACITGSVTLQKYRNKRNEIKDSNSLFRISDYAGERWGIFVEFKGKLRNAIDASEFDFWVLETSTKTFECFYILKFPWPVHFREGEIIVGTGEVKKTVLKIPGELSARSHTYVEVSYVVD